MACSLARCPRQRQSACRACAALRRDRSAAAHECSAAAPPAAFPLPGLAATLKRQACTLEEARPRHHRQPVRKCDADGIGFRGLAALRDGGGPIPPAAAHALLAEVESLLGVGAAAPQQRDAWWRFLDLTARPRFLLALGDDHARRRWAETVFTIIESTRYTLGDMFEQRVREAPARGLFQHADGTHPAEWSYERTARHVRAVAAVLLGPVRGASAPTAPGRARVAVFAENGGRKASPSRS